MNTLDTYPCDDVETEYGIFNGGYLIFQFDHVGPLTVSFSCHVTDASTRSLSLWCRPSCLFARSCSFLSMLHSVVQPNWFWSLCLFFTRSPFFLLFVHAIICLQFFSRLVSAALPQQFRWFLSIKIQIKFTTKKFFPSTRWSTKFQQFSGQSDNTTTLNGKKIDLLNY